MKKDNMNCFAVLNISEKFDVVEKNSQLHEQIKDSTDLHDLHHVALVLSILYVKSTSAYEKEKLANHIKRRIMFRQRSSLILMKPFFP